MAGRTIQATNTVGEYRFFAGAVIGDLWGLDHELSYQFTTSEEGIDHLGAHVLSYTLPLPFIRRTDLNFIGSYVHSESTGSITTQSGESYQLSANFHTQLPRLSSVAFDARYGFEYKRSNNDLEFGGTNVNATETDLGQFYAQIQAQKFWTWGNTSAHAGIWASPGGLFNKHNDTAFNASRARASADYAVLKVGLDQTIFLPQNILLTLDADAQLSSDRLISSEMFYIGGMRSVRGFGENIGKGDNGYSDQGGNSQPGFPNFRQCEREALDDRMRLFAFFDAGAVSYNGSAAVGDNNAALGGAGLGLQIQAWVIIWTQNWPMVGKSLMTPILRAMTAPCTSVL